MESRISKAIAARIQRASRRFTQAAFFVEEPRSKKRMKFDALAIDEEPQFQENGTGGAVLLRKSFLISEDAWRAIVQFLGDETLRNGAVFIESRDDDERRYLADAPQNHERRAAGNARVVHMTQITGKE